jgi:hypothetical protein
MPEESEVIFICEKCGAEYLSEKRAKECEALPVPEPKFKVGDKVIAQELIIRGLVDWAPINDGEIIEILGPCGQFGNQHARFPQLSYTRWGMRNEKGYVKKRHFYIYVIADGDGARHYYFEEELKRPKGKRK